MNESNAVMADKTIIDGMKELKEIKKERKLLEEREKWIKFEISKIIGDNENIINKDGVVIATYKFTTTNRFDTAAFKESYPDMYDVYTKPIEIRTFLIKE